MAQPRERFFVEEKPPSFVKSAIKIKVKTNKQKGDIAGTKSKKFFDFFLMKLQKEFKVKKSDFEYDDNKNLSIFYFILGKKKDEVIRGPHITHIEHVKQFKKKHPSAFIKGHYTYVKLSHIDSFSVWFKDFKKTYKKVMKQMGITELKIEKSSNPSDLYSTL